MVSNRYCDIKLELCELSDEIIAQIRAQIEYYRVSVYKDEAHKNIDVSVKNLRLVAKLLCSTNLKDLFEDMSAETTTYDQSEGIVECKLTMRITRLIRNFENEIKYIKNNTSEDESRYDLRKSVRKFRQEILAICPSDSRVQMFFQSV